jgi:hypothetical protein
MVMKEWGEHPGADQKGCVKNGLQVGGLPGGRVHITTVSGLADASPARRFFSRENRRDFAVLHS